MIVPYDQLSPEALQGLIEEYVTREGTDYGHHEVAMESKVAQVRALLVSGEAVILFSESKGLCNIVAKQILTDN